MLPRDVYKLSAINFLKYLYFLAPVMTFFYQSRGLSFVEILALESIFMFSAFLFEIPTGLVADRYGRKASIVLGISCQLIFSIIHLFANSFFLFALSFAITGLGYTFLSGCVEAHIYDTLKNEKKKHLMKRAMGFYGASGVLGLAMAPPVASILAQDLVPSQFMLLISLKIAFLIIAILIALTLKETNSPHPKSHLKLLTSGVHILRSNAHLRRIALLMVLSNPFIFALYYLYQPYFAQVGIPVEFFGTWFAVALVTAVVFQHSAHRIERLLGMKYAVLISTIVPGVLYMIMSVAVHPATAIVSFVFIRGLFGLRQPLFSDYQNIHIKSTNRATVLSIISMATGLYLACMRLFFGFLAERHIQLVFLVMGTLVLVFSVAFMINERHLQTPTRSNAPARESL